MKPKRDEIRRTGVLAAAEAAEAEAAEIAVTEQRNYGGESDDEQRMQLLSPLPRTHALTYSRKILLI